eukprot:TRINITY_DN2192_c0_g2_i2.p1 TRINITY_DN2192_c0_g2~~TRINITY_DN2192_c0_g2_i2.p1  ORF type:complete len:340 (-),score=-22.45 TRINITY_DN2192_c0_g2_i2:1118-2137(-)
MQLSVLTVGIRKQVLKMLMLTINVNDKKWVQGSQFLGSHLLSQKKSKLIMFKNKKILIIQKNNTTYINVPIFYIKTTYFMKIVQYHINLVIQKNQIGQLAIGKNTKQSEYGVIYYKIYTIFTYTSRIWTLKTQWQFPKNYLLPKINQIYSKLLNAKRIKCYNKSSKKNQIIYKNSFCDPHYTSNTLIKKNYLFITISKKKVTLQTKRIIKFSRNINKKRKLVFFRQQFLGSFCPETKVLTYQNLYIQNPQSKSKKQILLINKNCYFQKQQINCYRHCRSKIQLEMTQLFSSKHNSSKYIIANFENSSIQQISFINNCHKPKFYYILEKIQSIRAESWKP